MLLMRLIRVLFVLVPMAVVLPGHAAVEHYDDGSSHDKLYKQEAHRDYFYVGGEYVTGPTGETLMKNQMYVERLSTKCSSKLQPYPLVLIHGQGMSGANTWLNTPDGRPGWADYFLSQGYVVYIVDQPTRGRSPWLPGDFELTSQSAEYMSKRFTAPAHYNLWPQSRKHTQWPGNGTKGDPTYDAFYASTLQFLSNNTEAQVKTRNAVVALLDTIGPATLMVHSQGGFYGWAVADARPRLVKAIVALEPVGPPFQSAVFEVVPARAWGLTDIPLTYDPAVTTPEQIKTATVPSNETNVVDCILQAEPARKLANLKHVPVLVATGEASYHAAYDYCSVRFLQQAGVPVERMRLEDVGIHGNGHLMMMEKNNLDIAKVLHRWIRKTTVAGSRTRNCTVHKGYNFQCKGIESQAALTAQDNVYTSH